MAGMEMTVRTATDEECHILVTYGNLKSDLKAVREDHKQAKAKAEVAKREARAKLRKVTETAFYVRLCQNRRATILNKWSKAQRMMLKRPAASSSSARAP